MTLRVVGAGLGRTGTMSLKLALERLLGAPCYHMLEVFTRPEHVQAWHDASLGTLPDWATLFDGFGAAVDWPPVAFWEEIADAYPDALILLSVRDADAWWKSCDHTIFEGFRREPPPGTEAWREMTDAMLRNRFTPDFLDRSAAVAAFERHNETVRATAPADRLLEWRASEGWGPICDALGLPVPDEPFPHTNTTEEFRARAGLDV